ncbi:MAG: peptide deformylase [Oscillospiraceae bacterium]|nr:peptide deformylase [Oscillospiraceae bacterium]
MAIRKIRVDDDPILRKKSRPVEVFDDRLFELLDDMKDTLKKAEGLGLAAVQVGVLKRVVVVNFGDGFIELINPEILDSKGSQSAEEACLSLPRKAGKTLRPMSVKVRAQNRNGAWVLYEGSELKARCFCHEIDHLDGKLYIDSLAPGEKVFYTENYS